MYMFMHDGRKGTREREREWEKTVSTKIFTWENNKWIVENGNKRNEESKERKRNETKGIPGRNSTSVVIKNIKIFLQYVLHIIWKCLIFPFAFYTYKLYTGIRLINMLSIYYIYYIFYT